MHRDCHSRASQWHTHEYSCCGLTPLSYQKVAQEQCHLALSCWLAVRLLSLWLTDWSGVQRPCSPCTYSTCRQRLETTGNAWFVCCLSIRCLMSLQYAQCMLDHKFLHWGRISRVSGQNGVSQLHIMLEIHHSAQESLICRSNLPSHPVTVYWNQASQSLLWPNNPRRLVGVPTRIPMSKPLVWLQTQPGFEQPVSCTNRLLRQYKRMDQTLNWT